MSIEKRHQRYKQSNKHFQHQTHVHFVKTIYKTIQENVKILKLDSYKRICTNKRTEEQTNKQTRLLKDNLRRLTYIHTKMHRKSN